MRKNPDSLKNQQAWDALYRDSPGSVWGCDPIPFVVEFVRELEPNFSAESRHLDAATGEGRHLPALLSLPGKAHVTDASPSALDKLSRIPGDYETACCQLEHLPFDDAVIDFALLIDTIETLPNPDEALRELLRVLKPGGLLLCNIPGTDDGISSTEMKQNGNEAFYYRETYFYRFYEEPAALDLVRRNGFEVRRNEVRTWRENPHPGFRDYEHSHTSRVFLLSKPD